MPVAPDYMVYGPTEEQMTNPRTMEMPIEDVNNLDEVVHELDIESSDRTPAEAVRELKAKNDRLRKALYEIVHMAFPPVGIGADDALLNAHNRAKREALAALEE